VNTLISKLITAFFIGVFAVVAFLPLVINYINPGQPREAVFLGGVSAFLAVVFFLIVFMGLQISTSFVSSKIVDVLSPLPLSNGDISRVVFLCFIRIFDIPLVAAAAIFLAVYSFVGGSIVGGMISFASIVVTEIFALTITTVLARFFYSKVTSAGGRSRWQTLLRLVFMLVWILPTFAAYLVVSFAGQISQSFASLTQGLSSLSQILALVYPFSYGFLVTYTNFSKEADYAVLSLSIAASIVYMIIAYYSLRWLTRTVRTMGMATRIGRLREVVKDTLIKPQASWLGIIHKDLRIASRAPSFASLFLLPVMQTVILAISFSSFTELGLSTALGILTGITMITLLLPPTLLSIEGLASAYTRHLPTRKVTLITAKTLLSTFAYAISLIVLSIVALLMGKNFSLILTFGLIHGFSIAAAIMFESTILTRKFWKEGFSVGNLYSRITTYILILIPSFVLAAIPIVSAFVAFFIAPRLSFPIFLATAVAEFTLMTVIVITQK
jgi:hypothetical protein